MDTPGPHPILRILRITAGILLLLAGLAGLLLPLLPGIPLLVAGLLLLAPHSRLANYLKTLGHNLKVKAKQKLAARRSGKTLYDKSE